MRHRRERRLGIKHVLALPRKPLYLPHDIVMLGLVLCLTLRHPLSNARRVQGRRNAHYDICSEQLGAVLGADGDAVLDFGFVDFVDDGVDLERQVDVLGRAVAHELEFAVGRHERDHPICVEAPELHALVELAVFEGDGAGCRARGFGAAFCARGLEVRVFEAEAVVQAEAAFWCSREVGPHYNLTCYVGAENGALGGHEEVYVFDHIDEGFVFAVLDVSSPPRQCAGSLHRDLRRIFLWIY